MADPSWYNFFSQSQPSAAKRNAPSVQQLHPPPHLGDVATTVPGSLTLLKLSAATRMLTSASESLLGKTCRPTTGTAVLVEKWVEPIQPQPQPQPPPQHQDQNLASSSVPRSFLGVSTADALSTTTDEDDSANMDLTLRL
ncbi:hypothetical protein SLA2020_086150 [Shorea laevis]